MANWQNVTPEALLEGLGNGRIEPIQIIDVREPFEWDYYHLEGSIPIPMNTIPSRLGELDDSKTIYVICAHGVRSVAVCDFLDERGYGGIRNVEGGIAAVASLKGFAYD
ncbi:rhodanese-like domain-containing protein [Paenibacillus arenilitoris]|uniref:Rhodanese-like domain-containing protein n=1 Tax=Paenibacillus arenilitoris TaxID=2772299 RepID=A0A927CQ52_9BACL|nr:rhodanese-like domain-containing protein [Paenibacillus arenilitoris]MBD2869620.1 rhodanese-like domain-containing protein [Paenibacillus arenilitoris]